MGNEIKQIGNISINLEYYSGEDVYSDGDIEEELLSIVRQNGDFTEIITKDNRWPILYHLTPQRRNLLEWFNFDMNSSLLEIGAGCGALTGLFCQKVDKVVAVELSKRRAEIIAHRCKDMTNLEIIVGNLNDIKFQNKFDYITLIGVLEYAGKYTLDKNPFEKFLHQIKKYLKQDGVLFVAIENKFGLKYWSGAREDHTGKLFDSIENYPSDSGVRTFSKDELQNLLVHSGFTNLSFYYPIPDYKLPMEIYSDEYLPRVGQIRSLFHNYDQERIRLFNENIVYDELIKNSKFDFFANSFLVICKSEGSL